MTLNRDITVFVDVKELVANCDIVIHTYRENGIEKIDSFDYDIQVIVDDNDNYFQLGDFSPFEQEQITGQIEGYIEGIYDEIIY